MIAIAIIRWYFESQTNSRMCANRMVVQTDLENDVITSISLRACQRAVNWQTGCETRKSHGSVLSIKHWYWYWYWWWRRRTDLSSMEMSPIHHMTRHGDCREMCGTIEDPFLQTVHPSYPHSIHEFAASKLSSVIWHVVVVVVLLLLLRCCCCYYYY